MQRCQHDFQALKALSGIALRAAMLATDPLFRLKIIVFNRPFQA